MLLIYSLCINILLTVVSMSIFEAKSYVVFVKEKIHENSSVYAYKAQLAKAANCQRSYLSQVLAEKTHLTLDQAFKLAGFWNLDSIETQYFVHLVSKDRATTQELRNFYISLMEDLKQQQTNLAVRYQKQDAALSEQAIYYSDWLFAALQMLITIPKYQTVSALCQRLALPSNIIEASLKKMEKIEFVARKGDRYIPNKVNLHISSDSIFNSINHRHWRERAVQNSSLGLAESLHYTAIYSLSEKDIRRLQKMLLTFMDETRKIVAPSAEEDVICLNLDFFKV